MSYPFELRRREATAIAARRRRASETAALSEPPAEPGSTAPIDRLPEHTVGLALSGGGIRSATFSLGVLQALAKKNRLREVDILSTVSGGGYIGSFLGRLFTRRNVREQADPCGRVQAILGDNSTAQLQWLRTHANYILSQGGSDVREHLATFWRNLASIYFILAMLGIAVFGLLRLAGEWCRGVLPPPGFVAPLGPRFVEALSSWWWLPLAILAIAIAPIFVAYWLAPKAGTRASFSFSPLTGWIVLLAWLVAGLALPGGLVLCLFAMPVALLAILWLEAARSRLPGKLDRSTGESSADPGSVIRSRLTRGMGEALLVLTIALAWVVIDTIARGLAQGALWKLVAMWGAVLVPVAPFFRRWATFLGAGGRAKEKGMGARPGFLATRAFRAGLLAFPIAAFLLIVLDSGVHWLFTHDRGWGIAVTLLGLALTIVFGRAFDFLNCSALQKSYASRLSRTFLGASNPARVRAAAHEAGKDVQVVHPDDDLEFNEYHPENNGGPLHLIGLCVNETVDAASQRDIRDRKGLPMCVSPCGVSVGRRFHAVWSKPSAKLPLLARLRSFLDGQAPAQQDAPTALRAIPVSSELFHVFKRKSNPDAPVAVEPLQLGTWIAISGAAFGTGTGRSTSVPLALLLGLVNVRLGYWWNSGLGRTERPGQYPANFWRRLKGWPAALVKMQSLLLSDFVGRFGGPSYRFWNISDGGHFDVTGVYELIRRRVPFILAVDGSEDRALMLADSGELVRQVRNDFGANIVFLDPATLANGAVPAWITAWVEMGALGTLRQLGAAGGQHAALARVTYGNDSEQQTWIVLLKASLTGDESLDLETYKRMHPDFPAESTTDQFFDESQFESYRMLGEHVGLGTVKHPSRKSPDPRVTNGCYEAGCSR